MKFPEQSGLVHRLEERPDRSRVRQGREPLPEQLDHTRGDESGGQQDPREEGEAQEEAGGPDANEELVDDRDRHGGERSIIRLQGGRVDARSSVTAPLATVLGCSCHRLHVRMNCRV